MKYGDSIFLLCEERDNNLLLGQQIETFEFDKVKDMDTLDRDNSLSQELNDSKKELEVAHASLTKDLEHLEKANLLVKKELITLGENHDQLLVTYEKALGTMRDPIIVDTIACATNPSCDQACLIAENKKLKE